MRKILIIGKTGQVGWELQRTLLTLGHVVAVGKDQMDLLDPKSIQKIIREMKPQVIVNAAAYTAVDKAESELELAMAVNGRAPEVLAEEAKRLNAILVHYSTDYVFDGKATQPYSESSQTAPLNAYGRSKLVGEAAIQTVGGKTLIFRTSWVYGMRGRNFLLTMLKLAREKEELRIVNDQIGAPTWSRQIAQATAHILSQNLTSKEIWGLYHLIASGQTSWKGFAEAIFKNQSVVRIPKIVGIPTLEYPTPAKRPAYSLLSNDKVQKVFGLTLPAWDDALRLCMDNMD